MSGARQFGWLDTNLFVHALFPRDPHYVRCQAIFDALESGAAEGWIEPMVVHELTYVLGRLPSLRDRTAVHEYLRTVLSKDGV